MAGFHCLYSVEPLRRLQLEKHPSGGAVDVGIGDCVGDHRAVAREVDAQVHCHFLAHRRGVKSQCPPRNRRLNAVAAAGASGVYGANHRCLRLIVLPRIAGSGTAHGKPPLSGIEAEMVQSLCRARRESPAGVDVEMKYVGSVGRGSKLCVVDACVEVKVALVVGEIHRGALPRDCAHHHLVAVGGGERVARALHPVDAQPPVCGYEAAHWIALYHAYVGRRAAVPEHRGHGHHLPSVNHGHGVPVGVVVVGKVERLRDGLEAGGSVAAHGHKHVEVLDCGRGAAVIALVGSHRLAPRQQVEVRRGRHYRHRRHGREHYPAVSAASPHGAVPVVGEAGSYRGGAEVSPARPAVVLNGHHDIRAVFQEYGFWHAVARARAVARHHRLRPREPAVERA